MVVFLLQQQAILRAWLRYPGTRKQSANSRSIRFYGGAPAPFIGASGLFHAQRAYGGLPLGSDAKGRESTAAEISMDAVHSC